MVSKLRIIWKQTVPGYPPQVITNVIFNGTIDQFVEAFGRRTAWCYSQLERRHDYIQWLFPGACFFHRRLYCSRAEIVCKYRIHARDLICCCFDFLCSSAPDASRFNAEAQPLSAGACTINRPCAQEYVGKYQSCMVISGRKWSYR